MASAEAPTMSDRVEEADWIRDRLTPWSERVVTSIVPTGFEAYVRILHPAQLPATGRELVRWSEVSSWSGEPISRTAQWHDIALPRVAPTDRPPWRGQGPLEGGPYREDLLALVDVLSPRTDTPEPGFFCVWNGFFTSNAVSYGSGVPSVTLPRPDQPPRLVELPHRSYGLFEGALTGVTSIDIADRRVGQAPNLWWPRSRSWIVVSEIDLPWTYVGASRSLIDRIVAEPRLESLPAQPDDSYVSTLSGWLRELLENANNQLLDGGSASLALSLGTVEMTWRRRGLRRQGTLLTTTVGPNGTSSSEQPLRSDDEAYRRLVVYSQVQRGVLALIS